ncbi:MAG: polyribonucleotide nucleotidyltransferase, partial [Proteobacteria bacterium]|nr:polyribonucleotide nucleotidyltransferase [Pseudomonadota bacterium]
MFNITKKSVDFYGKELTLETGKLARQADGAVMVTFGKTQVLCTICYKKDKESACDFLPLTVVYQEKFYANGKIPGGFLKRESKPSDREVLISRLIDRSVRPLFDKNFNNEAQLICTVMSYDETSSTELPALLGAMAALKISGAPINATVAGVKIGLKDDAFYINNTPDTPKDEQLDVFVVGTTNSVLMVESEIKELPETKVIESIEFGLKAISQLTDFVDDFASNIIKPRFEQAKIETKAIYDAVKKFIIDDVKAAFDIKAKQERTAALSALSSKVKAEFIKSETTDGEKAAILSTIYELEKEVVRGRILSDGVRIDGRKLDEIRQIEIELNPLTLTHGSALFTRGETQALAVLTLGSGTDEQMLDSIASFSKDDFMLHYNFPGFSVGEVSRMMGPGRREIGHGNLAKKAVVNILPSKAEFPYAKRIVSEVLESNGSSSMATVCASSLAFMA